MNPVSGGASPARSAGRPGRIGRHRVDQRRVQDKRGRAKAFWLAGTRLVCEAALTKELEAEYR